MKLIYKGPDSSMTLRLADTTGKSKEVREVDYLLRDGREYELPEDSQIVKTLVKQGLFVPAPATTPAPVTTEKGGK